MLDEFLQKIKSKKIKIGIIGGGYVGLPLAFIFLKKKFSIFLIDKDKKKIESLKNNKIYLDHLKNFNLKKYKKNFFLYNNFSIVSKIDIIIICLPTPLKNKIPDLSYVRDCIKMIRNDLKKNAIVVLESSTYPTTTSNFMRKHLEKNKKLKLNKNYFLGYSPEREDPGTANQMRLIPKIVSSDDKRTLRVLSQLYKNVFYKVVLSNSSKIAEATKLYENIFRAVNISMVNELKIVFDKLGIDIWEVIRLANTKGFGFMPFYPGPGIGGHCIPVDPFYLSWIADKNNVKSDFIKLSGLINYRVENFILQKIRNLKKKKILIIGIAYKKNVHDLRESPSIRILSRLKKEKYNISYNDILINKIPIIRKYKNIINIKSKRLNKNNINDYPIILINVIHDKFNKKIFKSYRGIIIDTQNCINNTETLAKIVKA